MFMLLQHLGLPTGAAIVVIIIIIKIVKAALARRFPGSGAAYDRHNQGLRR